MELSPVIIAILIVSGFVVGFINTLAGGGSVISLTIFMAMGLPIQLANGTNRISIIMQNLSSTTTFYRRGMLDWKTGLKLSVPVIAGTIIGSHLASVIDDQIFQISLIAVMIGVLALTLAGDKIWKGGGETSIEIRSWHYVLFLLIGVYGGYLYVGMGYLILLVTMGALRLNIIKSNVIKALIIFISVPFSLMVFIINGNVDYAFGLIHGAGNMIGAYIASRYAINWGLRFLRWFMAAVVLFCLADIVGLISIRNMILAIL